LNYRFKFLHFAFLPSMEFVTIYKKETASVSFAASEVSLGGEKS
jgi:hypothetical protein